MVKKKFNPVKGTKKRGESLMTEDVKVHTGLPPKVDGQLRCFCKVSINQVLWSTPSPPITVVQVKWWGEEGEGALFRPLDVKKGNKSSACTTARYPVRSGPRQFASYLNDMGTLSVAVFTSEPITEPVGHALISQIGQLSNNKPVNGFFPIFSAKDKKIGELQVSVMLEPLMASYDDNMGSIPTTDLTLDPRHSQESTLPSATRPQPHSQQPVKPQEDPFISPASHLTEDARLQNGARTQNAADLRQRLHYDLGNLNPNQGYPVAITANGDVVGMSDLHGNGVPMVGRREQQGVQSSPQRIAAVGRHGNSDLLSVLLSRGTELRQAMVVSSLNAQDQEQNNSNVGLQSPSSRAVGAAAPVAATYSPAPGVMVDNLLDHPSQAPVDMLLGSPVGKHEWQMLQMLNGASPGPSLCSEGMEEMDVASEPGDPLHDRTLLQELFYKRSDSELSELSGLSGDEGGSLKDPGNARPPSRSSSFSNLAAALPAPNDTPTKKRKRKLRANSVSSDSSKNVRKSRSRSKERNPRMTKTVTGKKSKSRSRSRSRSRSKSRSLSQKRKGSLSDSDVASTPRSEASRVSFDPVPSDVEDDLDQDPREKQVDGLSVERLTLLGRVHVARVNVLSLSLHGSDLDSSYSSKTSSRSARRVGKPPRPVKNRKPCTYLIEYQFPVVATSRDKYSPNAMATEVMRVASKAINNGVISFSHRSVFPLMFDGAALEKWWKSALIFKVYSREARQKAPVLLGSCGVPLKSILKSDDLHLERELEIRELNRNGSFSNSARNSSLNSSRSAAGAPLLGVLKVSVELASDHKDFATSLARTRVAEMSSHGQNVVPVVPPPPPPVPPLSLSLPASPTRQTTNSRQSAKHASPARQVEKHPGYSSKPSTQPVNSHSAVPSSLIQDYAQLQKQVFQINAATQPSSQHEAMTLHTLIMIPEGCNISLHGVPPLHMVSRNPALLQQQLARQAQLGSGGRDQMTRNTYLVCRMFWSNDSVHSNVCWGALNPQYNFSQVAPVLVTPSLLERMRNNYMVIEVWDKKTAAENDKLIGMAKLSLHQFFMSFRDPKISGALLRSEYPVVAIDNCMPIVDPFSGLHFGQLSVLLAMGSADQVACLQRLKVDREGAAGMGPQRPNHFLERQDVYGPDQSGVRLDSSGTSVEHAFEVVIQEVRGLKLLETMIWGEADCFVQYFFPAQGQTQQQGPTVVLAMPTLRSFRTATTLCIPDPTFHDVTRHRITLPVGTPVQRELLTACANSAGGSGGLPFEVWCRFYHPNVRDQVIARATLPLAKLCAMVTMQKRGEPSVQSFSLPLTPVAADVQDTEGQAKLKDSGLLDVTVNYKTQKVETTAGVNVSQPSSGSQVCVSVGVVRASGLKAAAEAAARMDSGMQYPAEVGVNAYVRLRLSFLGKQEERITKTVARTFSPEFSHHVEFPLQLLWSGGHDDPGSLAQMLETGQAEFEVWHQVPGTISGVMEYECDDTTGGKRLVQTPGDVLLGTCTVPLAHLLVRHAGIKGWFPVDRPSSTWTQSEASQDGPSSRMVGGLELTMHFAHNSDRQRVVEAARSVGWSPVDPAVEQDDWQEEETGQQQHHQLMVNIEQVSLPLSRVLLPGQTALDPSARCYVRYKFYDRAAVVSRTSRLQGEGERLQAVVHHRHTLVLPHTAPFQWYLRGEQLEVQLWVTFGSKDKGQRPLQRDKLIGTAYVDLLPLCDSRRKQHRISGLLPVFKPGATNLSGAFIQLHLTSNLCHGSQLLDDEDDVVENGELSDVDYDSSDSFHQLTGGARSPVKKGQKEKAVDLGSVFTVHLAVERALHLPTVRIPGRSGEAAPTTYISYQTADKATPTYSEIVADTVNPVWDYTAEVYLSNDLLTQESKNLVLKVWHKPEGARKQPDKSSDRVLGFVSVDLCPLNSGLRQICGWYNIVDFNGQSRGQIKVSITPVDLVAPGNSAAATGGPSVSMLSSRGGSICQPSDPVAGFSLFPMSLPVLSSLPSSSSNAAVSGGAPISMPSAPVPSLHWQPRFAVPASAAAGDSSKSMLFSSLRQQLRDLDGLTQRLRLRLSCEDSDIDANQPASARSADILTGTHSGLSTIHTSSSFTGTREVLSDVSRQLLGSRELNPDTSQQQNGSTSEDNTSHNAVDSGAFSGNNTGKSQEAPDSQRSDKQVAFSTGQTGTATVLSGLPPSSTASAGTAASAMEAQFLTESPQGALTPRSPRDFSSNSQTSQGFQPMAAAAASDSSVSGSTKVKVQAVPSLTNLATEDDDEDTPRPAEPTAGADAARAEAMVQEYHHNPADYHSDDNSDDDEMFGSYHQYRAMLDREEEENHRDDEEDGGSNVETITPRRINDVSGMLRQFAQHPGTLPPVFPPPQAMSSGDASFTQTWPNVSHHGRTMERPRDDQEEDDKEIAEEEEEEEEEEEIDTEELPAEQMQTERTDVLQDRNSFIDSWLENSAEHEQDMMRQTQPQQLASLPRSGDHSTLVQHLELGLTDSEEEESEAETPRANGTESAVVKGKPPAMHLLSNVELIDTFTSVNSAARRTRGGSRPPDSTLVRQTNGVHREQEHEDIPSNGSAFAHVNGGPGVPHNPHLLSNVELYSTTSSFHPAARPPRHLLSNVELASTASGSSHHPDTASSRPSRQSSANSGGRRAELEVCEEIENSEDEAEFQAPQPLSVRSDDVSDFFTASRPPAVVNGGRYDSSEEELEYQHSSGAQAAVVKSRVTVKGREPCQSITATTEDSGLESGAKSSQDEREALSLLDSTQGQGQSYSVHNHSQSQGAAVPEFFLPTEQLQASMRALQLATSAVAHAEDPQTRSAAKAQASADLLHRLRKAGKVSGKFNGTVSAKGRQLPTAEEAKRIAKIFSTKPS